MNKWPDSAYRLRAILEFIEKSFAFLFKEQMVYLNMDKVIAFSEHARLQMLLRGAEEHEVATVIRLAEWHKARQNKLQARYEFPFNDYSPVNNQFYKFKIVDVIFVDEPNKIVVVTVKVYYHN